MTETADPALPGDGQGVNWLLIRRSIPTGGDARAEYAFYRAYAPGSVLLQALVTP